MAGFKNPNLVERQEAAAKANLPPLAILNAPLK